MHTHTSRWVIPSEVVTVDVLLYCSSMAMSRSYRWTSQVLACLSMAVFVVSLEASLEAAGQDGWELN